MRCLCASERQCHHRTHETNQINRTLEYRLLDELNAELGSSYTLSDQEVLVCHTKDFTEGMTLQIDGSNSPLSPFRNRTP